MTNTKILQALAAQVRWHILTSTTAAGSGHPSSSLSAADLMTVLMFGGFFHADLKKPHALTNDRLIFSKGHAAPLLYALYAAAGAIRPADLRRLRKSSSPLEGHPMPEWPYTEVPTGSLGQGLAVGVGEALAAKMRGIDRTTFVLLGDGEMAEGSVWEAIAFAGHAKLGGLVAVLDVNRLGQSGSTMLGWKTEEYKKRLATFGWQTIVINGHNIAQIQRAFATAGRASNRPVMIIAKTIKGKGVRAMENKEGWHGQVLSPTALERAKKEFPNLDLRIRGVIAPPIARVVPSIAPHPIPDSTYRQGALVSPRQAAGRALLRLAPAWPTMVVLDGDVKNSTHTDMVAQKYPAQFVEGYIAEQLLAGMANGLAHGGMVPVVATFAAFWTRAFDQLRMMHYSGVHGMFLGTHAGVHIGEDGASQMGLEDIAMFRALPGSIVLYPSDAIMTERLIDLGLRAKGLVYVRLTRAALPVISDAALPVRIGGSITRRSSAHDIATIVAAGVTVHEALRAADKLLKRKKHVRVIDAYSIAPIDAATLRRAAKDTGRLIVVEDHRAAGGIADAVRSALGPLAGAVVSLAVHETPHSGTPEENLRHAGIDANAIVRAVLHTKL